MQSNSVCVLNESGFESETHHFSTKVFWEYNRQNACNSKDSISDLEVLCEHMAFFVENTYRSSDEISLYTQNRFQRCKMTSVKSHSWLAAQL